MNSTDCKNQKTTLLLWAAGITILAGGIYLGHGLFQLGTILITEVVVGLSMIVAGGFWFGRRTAQRLAESRRQARLNERRIQAIVDSAVDSIITISAQGQIQSVNPAAEKLFGFTQSEMIGRNITMLMPSPYRDEHDRYLANYLATGQANVVGIGREVVGRKKNGDSIPLWLSVSRVTVDADEGEDAPHFFTGILRDLTEQKRRERELMEANRKAERLSTFGQILDQSFSEIYIFSADTLKFVHVNHGARENIGYSMDELRLLTPIAIKPEHTAESFAELVAPLVNGTQEFIRFDTVHRRKDGSEYPVDVRLQSSRFQGESVYAAVVVDITERRHYEQALQKSKEKALAADRSKSEFLTNMSHEIRTPMTAILGFTEVLLGNLKQSEDIEAAQTVQRNAEHLLHLINDILDLSRIEAGKVEVEHVKCSPHAIIDEVHALMKVRAAAKGIPVNVRCDGPLPEFVATDPTRVRQILINLLGNAIKFTETGQVELVVSATTGPNAKLRFDVVDTGIGIPGDQLDQLFDPFTQADNSVTRQYGGTGLGLSITRRLVELLGGDIGVTSEVGIGTTFTVTIRAETFEGAALVNGAQQQQVPAKQPKKKAVPPAALKGIRILLVEDGPDNQRLISFLLRKAGAEVAVADNGQIGYDLATTAADNNEPFDLILMDMQMPVLDGYGATRRLRSEGYTLPVIALTAHAMATDRKKCLDAGCDEYLTKPIDRGLLIETIQRFVIEKQSEEVEPTCATGH